MRKFVVLFGILLSLTAFAASAGRYHLLKTVPVPGNEGWDYLTVDTPSRHVFISHGSRVVVGRGFEDASGIPAARGPVGMAAAGQCSSFSAASDEPVPTSPGL